jgi:hypothetical protein
MLMNRAHHEKAILRQNNSQVTPLLLVRTSLFWFCHRHTVWGTFEICQRFLWGDKTTIFGMPWALSDTIDGNVRFLTFNHDIKKPPSLGKVRGNE